MLTTLAALEEKGMILELPRVFPRHLGDVPPDDAGRLLAGNALRLYRLDDTDGSTSGGAPWQR